MSDSMWMLSPRNPILPCKYSDSKASFWIKLNSANCLYIIYLMNKSLIFYLYKYFFFGWLLHIRVSGMYNHIRVLSPSCNFRRLYFNALVLFLASSYKKTLTFPMTIDSHLELSMPFIDLKMVFNNKYLPFVTVLSCYPSDCASICKAGDKNKHP